MTFLASAFRLPKSVSRRDFTLTLTLTLALALALCFAAAALPASPSPPRAQDPQQQAASEIDQIGTAMFAWWLFNGGIRSPWDRATSYDLTPIPVISHATLEGLLVPDYLTSLPELDPWGTAYEFRFDTTNFADVFLSVRSAGSDATFEGTSYDFGQVTDPSQDLVWYQIGFIRYLVATGNEQQRTAAEMKLVGDAIVSWRIDQLTRSPSRAGAACDGVVVDLATLPVVTDQTLATLLVPTYLAAVPVDDAWGNPYEYRLDQNDPGASTVASIRSSGADGVFEGTVYTSGFITDPNEDLVWLDGVFHRSLPTTAADSQQVSLAVMQAVGTSMVQWLSDTRGLKSRGPASLDLSLYQPISQTQLSALLVPQYIDCVPERDGWGNLFDYWLDESVASSQFAAIRSLGSDGAAEGPVYPVETYPAAEDTRDIVWADGSFVYAPDNPTIFWDTFESGLLAVWN